MYSKMKYLTELIDLTVDLRVAIENQDNTKVDEIVETAATILSDIQTAEF